MFWGLIMEPQRRYTQVVKRPFHISMASLDVSISSNEPAQVLCGFEGRNYLLCTLRKPDMLQVPLDLNFEVGDELALGTNGNCYVHLTGYIIDEPADLLGEEEDEEVEEEPEEKEVKKKNKKRNKQDIQNGPPTKKLKATKAQEDEDLDDDDDDDDDDSDVDVKALLENTLESDEGDETFNSDDEGNEEEEEEDEEEEEEGEEEEDELGDEEESSLSEDDSEEEEEETVQPQKNKQKVNGVSPKQEVQSLKQQKEQQKDKKNKKQQNKEDKNSSIKENQSLKKDSPKKLQNGLIVEDIKEGQGQPAKPGKLITVYYEGRLKSNNKMFDSTKQGQGFSFRLGAGEVIKGWDAGLVGMKVGGKRRITCPPQMAYGAKGSPPVIPGNSTLVFEVELRKLR